MYARDLIKVLEECVKQNPDAIVITERNAVTSGWDVVRWVTPMDMAADASVIHLKTSNLKNGAQLLTGVEPGEKFTHIELS